MLIKVELPDREWFGKLRSDEGLTLEMSAFRIVHGGNSTFINMFWLNQIFLFHSPTDAAPQFL